MNDEEYRAHDGLGLALLVAEGEVSPPELVDIALRRMKDDPDLNAIVVPLEVEARRRATSESLSGPFAGVPFVVKDLMQDIAGVPTSSGNRALRAVGLSASTTSVIVERWLAAGTVVIGKTNTPEFGAKGITEPEAFGPTRNPWDRGRSPGGSSGGSAAAVAAGIVPLAGANDGGGSIRIPASHCGLFGFKPGRGRTPWGPGQGEQFHGGAINHVVTRSVRDSAAMLDATHGPERASLSHLAPPERPYLEECGRDPGRCVIAFSTRSPIGTDVDPEAVAAVEQAARLLEKLGHDVIEGEPHIDGLELATDFTLMWFTSMARRVSDVKAATGCGDDGFELDTLAMAAFGRSVSAEQYQGAYERAVGTTGRLAEFFGHHDLYLTPTVAFPASRIGEIATPGWQHTALRALRTVRLTRLVSHMGSMDETVRENLRWTPFTQLANVAGTPAMSVPLHWTADGLPLGIQLGGPVGSEGLLFQVAGQLESAQPWFERIPRP